MFEDLELSNAPYFQLVELRDQLEEYVLLDLEDSVEDVHLLHLFDLCERLQLTSCVQQLYYRIQDANVEMTSRLKAASKFNISIHTNKEYISRFDSICQYLDNALLFEEDSNKKVVATFTNYYLTVMDHHEMWLPKLRECILNKQYEYNILSTDEVAQLLEFDTSNRTLCREQIIAWKDNLLGRLQEVTISAPQRIEDLEDYQVYKQRIENLQSYSFRNIRGIAVQNVNPNDHLQTRGVTPLVDVHELMVYMKCYGNMHYAKIHSLLTHLDTDLNVEYELIDWGCGQGIASMAYLEFCKKNQLSMPSRVTLIEPSSIAIKLAELHINKMHPNCTVRAICSGFDELRTNWITTDAGKLKVHIFSNVLDVDLYSIRSLERMIIDTQQGKNIFLCVSPYINLLKTERVNSFVNAFRNKEGFHEYWHNEVSQENGCYWMCNEQFNNRVCDTHASSGCEKKWTMVANIFGYGLEEVTAPDVFISYSTKDYLDENNNVIPGNIITQIQNQLSAAGISYWIDRNGLVGGDHFPERIAQQIHDSKVLLFVSTENSNQSRWTANEIATAHHYGKTIIPFKVDSSTYSPAVMIYIATNQYIPYQNNPNAMQQMVDAIRSAL